VEARAGVVSAFPAESARALRAMVPGAAAECVSRLRPADAALVVERLGVDAAVPMLRHLPADAAERILSAAPAQRRDELRRVLRHPERTAGALMDPAILVLPEDITVADARLRLRRAEGKFIHYLYVVDAGRRLVGVLDMPELMRARARDPLRMAMHHDVASLGAWTPAAAVHMHPGWRSFHAMPVVDENGRLLGAIRYQTLRRLEHDAAAGRDADAGAQTAAALGELFRVGVAGLIDAVAAGAPPRTSEPSSPPGVRR
jgi:magnesium transporter